MHFIEQIFHIAPDNGSGLIELSIIMAILSVPAAIFTVRRRLKRRTNLRA